MLLLQSLVTWGNTSKYYSIAQDCAKTHVTTFWHHACLYLAAELTQAPAESLLDLLQSLLLLSGSIPCLEAGSPTRACICADWQRLLVPVSHPLTHSCEVLGPKLFWCKSNLGCMGMFSSVVSSCCVFPVTQKYRKILEKPLLVTDTVTTPVGSLFSICNNDQMSCF